MTRKKKTAHDDASIEGGKVEKPGRQADGVSNFDSTTGDTRRQGIFALLSHGEENAVGTETLLRLTGCKTARQLQERISAERERGAVILSSGRGYFLPAEGKAGRHELARFIATLERRAAGTLRAAAPARAALEQQQTEGGTGAKT